MEVILFFGLFLKESYWFLLILGQEYLGATGLHLAIAYNNDELAQCIIECGVNIHIRARGTFFLPADQQHDTPLKVTDYAGLAYLGINKISLCCS